MASRKRQRSIDDEPKPVHENVDSMEVEGEEFDDEEIQVDFVFRTFENNDDTSLVVFLKHYLPKTYWNVRELALLIVENKDVGSTIRVDQEDSDDIFGFITALNINKHKNVPAMRTIINFVTKKAKKHGGDNATNWVKSLAAPSTGLLISRRLGNMPDAMAPHLLGTIVSELQALSKHFKEWQIQHFVVITQGYTVEKDHDNERANAPAKKQRGETEEIYEMLEDQLFAEIATAELRWGGERSYSFGTYTDMFNVIFLVPTNKLQYAIDKMIAMFQEQ